MNEPVSLRLLGGLDISRAGIPMQGFVSQKGPALVAYLSVTGHSQTRDHLAGLLWSDVPGPDARASLRVVLSNLRQTLGSGHFAITRSHVALRNDTAGIESDVELFMRALDTPTGNESDDLEALERAARHYNGDFLAELNLRGAALFNEWIAVERERIRGQAIHVFERLAELQSSRRNHEAAIATLKRLLEIEPWHEHAARQHMMELALAGRRTAALIEYDNFTQLLKRDLGVSPEPETTRLYDQIRDSELGGSSIGHVTETAQTQPAIQKPAHDTSLRDPGSSFVGRQAELERIAAHLHDPAIRLISLVGPGGSGKSRLALRVLEIHKHEFQEGVLGVPLAATRDPDQILPSVAEALQLPTSASRQPLPAIANYLRHSSLLLLLDNFEHLMSGVDAVNQLLDAVPGLVVLVTSRERLALQAEWVVPVGGLEVPDEEFDHQEGLDAGAMRLFIDRARQMRPDFLPSTDDLRSIAVICRHVEGFPLGVELAASWIQLMDCAEIAKHIEESFDFLSTTVRDIPDRHRSLRAVFDGSWILLEPREQKIFASLGAFSGGFALDSAQSVSGCGLQDLQVLVAKSLLHRGQSGRYILHELLAQYARECLNENQDFATTVRDAHATYFADLMVETEALLKGPGQVETLRRVERDESNLATAWSWMLARGQYQLIESALDGVGLFHYLHHRSIQGLKLLHDAESALVAEFQIKDNLEVLLGRINAWQAHFHLVLGRLDLAEEYFARAEALVSRHGSFSQVAYGTDIKGRIVNRRGNLHEALSLFQRSLEEARRAKDRFGQGIALNRLGGTQFDLGNLPKAIQGFQRSVAARSEIHDWEGVARDLNNLADAVREAGDFKRARSLLEDSIALRREQRIGTFPPTFETWGHLALDLGLQVEAEAQLELAIQSAEDQGDQITSAICTLRLAELAMMRNDLARADEMLTFSWSMLREFDYRPGLVEHGIVRSRYALINGQPDEGLEHAELALTRASEIGNLLKAEIARGACGRALLKLGRIVEAAEAFRTAIRSAQASGARPALLDLIVGACQVKIEGTLRSSGSSNSACAVNVATDLLFVKEHPATWYSTQERLDEILQSLDPLLDLPAWESAREGARSLTLELMVSRHGVEGG